MLGARAQLVWCDTMPVCLRYTSRRGGVVRIAAVAAEEAWEGSGGEQCSGERLYGCKNKIVTGSHSHLSSFIHSRSHRFLGTYS